MQIKYLKIINRGGIMLIDMEKIYKQFKQFNKKDWKQVDKEMTKIIKTKEKNIYQMKDNK